MTCQEFWNRETEAASPHLDECPACARAMAQQRAVAEGLRAVAQEWRIVEAPARLESRLVAAFHGHAGLSGRPGPSWVPVVTWFSAAAALALVALLLVRDREPKPAPRATPPAIQYAVAQTPFEIEGLEGEFIPLPNAVQIASGEEVNVVRVEVPRSAMLALGLEVLPEHAEESVSADVMLGADGLARAVRFLEE